MKETLDATQLQSLDKDSLMALILNMQQVIVTLSERVNRRSTGDIKARRSSSA